MLTLCQCSKFTLHSPPHPLTSIESHSSLRIWSTACSSFGFKRLPALPPAAADPLPSLPTPPSYRDSRKERRVEGEGESAIPSSASMLLNWRNLLGSSKR